MLRLDNNELIVIKLFLSILKLLYDNKWYNSKNFWVCICVCGVKKQGSIYTNEGGVEFTPVSVDELEKIVLKSPSKSCMLDPIPTLLLKQCTSELIPFITKIVNLSIESAKMPEAFKPDVITPFLKKKGLDFIYKNYCLSRDYPSYEK